MITFTREHGFSLLEVAVAVLVVVTAVPLFAAIQIGVAKRNAVSTQSDVAIWAAEAKLEEFTTIPFDQVVAGSETILQADGVVLQRDWTVAVDQPVPGLKTVAVTVVDTSIEEAVPVTVWFVVGPRGS